jgi:hypothetical protein
MMSAQRVAIALLMVSCLLVAGCVESMQTVQATEKNVSAPENTASSPAPDGGILQPPGMPAGIARLPPDDHFPPPTSDTRQAYEPLVGPYGDLSRNTFTQQDQGSTESITGSSSGSSGSSPPPAADTDTGLAAPMPASGLGSFTEPGQTHLLAPGAGSTGNPPGEYYEGAGAVITPYPTRDPNSCGCAM